MKEWTIDNWWLRNATGGIDVWGLGLSSTQYAVTGWLYPGTCTTRDASNCDLGISWRCINFIINNQPMASIVTSYMLAEGSCLTARQTNTAGSGLTAVVLLWVLHHPAHCSPSPHCRMHLQRNPPSEFVPLSCPGLGGRCLQCWQVRQPSSHLTLPLRPGRAPPPLHLYLRRVKGPSHPLEEGGNLSSWLRSRKMMDFINSPSSAESCSWPGLVYCRAMQWWLLAVFPYAEPTTGSAGPGQQFANCSPLQQPPGPPGGGGNSFISNSACHSGRREHWHGPPAQTAE